MTPLLEHTRIEVGCAGQTLWLLAEKAVWWPARRMLMIADVHIGKAASYRVLGQPVPHGTTQDNLQRLDRIIARMAPSTLVFLGDFLHGPELHAATGPTMAALREWRARHAGLECVLIRGNHDARAGDPEGMLRMEVVEEPYRLGGLALCHHPQVDAGHYVLAGHNHPAYLLRGRGRDRLRLPCFAVGPDGMVLPAFGAFTGVSPVEPDDTHQVYVVGADEIWPVRRAPGP
jgi:DNA ligase-associated metallophosphoesterase